MANDFVWAGASGDNSGDSWENARPSLMIDWGAEAGFTPATDIVYVRSSHVESTAGLLTLTGSTAEGTVDAVNIFCVAGNDTGTTPGALATGASVTASGVNNIYFQESFYIYGVNFFSGNDIYLGQAAKDHNQYFEQCRLELTGGAADIMWVGTPGAFGCLITLKDVDIDFAVSTQTILCRGGKFKWIGGSVGFDVAVLIKQPTSSGFMTWTAQGVDFSVLASPLANGATSVAGSGIFIFSRCLLATSGTFITGTIDVPGYRVEGYHCQIGTDSDPAYQMEINDSRGKIVTDAARYRTDGASDGERSTPVSWDFDTTVGSVRGYPGHALESLPITAWTDGDGSTEHTYRVYFASDASINDDELWMSLEGPNDAATNSKSVFQTTRVAPETAAAAHTTDAVSSWTGSGVTTKQYMEVSYTPDKPGLVTAVIHMAKASDNIYIDPFIDIDPS